MFRFASLAPVCLILAGCADIALPDLGITMPGAAETPAVRDFPVQDSACVGAVRQEVRVVDVRIEERTPAAGETVIYELAVGRDGTRWTCTASAAGEVTAVGLLRGPEPTPPLNATAPRPAAPVATQPAAPAPSTGAVSPAPAPATVTDTPAAVPSSGPVILRETESGPAVLPTPDPRSTQPTEPLPAFN
ncbi:hypothetical protein [Histidinibacterium lentulum]|uniref:Uncharacterized protein n=1 Tax=Histidinibacterium lentulum TaxID=2480588 RepID=A0A3N2R0R9_9RHOB|nr:hypothetical protein [Histidinibacterium lentulum]ROU01062.1 hypothetical protein EAT49_11085 [Histidinibacterium lentulum]